MLVQHRAVSSIRSITTRICLRCGYDGQELQVANEIPAFVCPACCEDLYARPPQSYAELELLISGTQLRRSGLVPVKMLLVGRLRAMASRLGRLVRLQLR